MELRLYKTFATHNRGVTTILFDAIKKILF